MQDFALSLLMLAALALALGAGALWRRGERRRPALMVLLAALMLANVLIWVLPLAPPR